MREGASRERELRRDGLGADVSVEKFFEGRAFFVGEESSAVVDDAEPMLARLSDVKPGDVFVDVGAGHGTYALRAAVMAGRNGQVLAFEPHPPTREVLIRNVLLNGDLLSGNYGEVADIMVIESALFDGPEYPPELYAEVFGRHYPLPENAEVDVCKLDDFELDVVDWIKIDVEGAELGVIDGALGTIARCGPTLLIEDHDGVNPDPACVVSRYAERIESSRRIRGLLDGLGYEIEVLPWGCGRRFLVATCRSRR